ncbi:hypothetical protein H072_3327 [Dactylellina haptotyla CBS 200.50]|uniref:Altered inheritance of mitochondria protein 41 n=1 Tax=Dactylellina haptotyla (strain CBS 200.50) TaxID=1284197 RepID=S8ANH5_DACHA|nr:hypothetical protein H072_3327 [Dactylellina haptotyla CBS 200.50]
MFSTRRLLGSRSLSRQLVRAYSDAAASAKPAPPPLLTKLRADMKDAMKKKEKEKLNVVKAILAEISNAGMTNPPQPVKNDLDILKILQAIEKKHNVAIASFETADRKDLADKEKYQLEVVKGYAGQVEVMDAEEVRELVDSVIAQIKQDGKQPNIGIIIKGAQAKAGELGKPVLSADIAAAAKELLK